MANIYTFHVYVTDTQSVIVEVWAPKLRKLKKL